MMTLSLPLSRPIPPALVLLAVAFAGPALGQRYVFDTGDTEYALGMDSAKQPGELAMLQGFDALGSGGTDVLTEIQVAVGTATQSAGALDGSLIVIAVWNDPTNDYDPSDAVLLYSAAPVSVVNSNTDIKVRYAVPGVPVEGVFFIGAVLQDLGNFPVGADVDVAHVGHPVAWMVGEGPNVSLDLKNLSQASFPPVALTEGVMLSASGESPIGTIYCSPATPNSTGFAATISASGSPFVVDNAVTLTAEQLPPGQFGYFLVGQTQGSSVPPGSQGTLCLSGTIGRYNRAGELFKGPSGSLKLDLTAIPVNPPQAVLSGETWNFQAWYRDVNPAPTSNFTDGVAVTFI